MMRLYGQLESFLGGQEDKVISDLLRVFNSAKMKFSESSDTLLRAQNALFAGAPALPDGLSGAALLAQCVVNAEKTMDGNGVVNFYRSGIGGDKAMSVFDFCLSGSGLEN